MTIYQKLSAVQNELRLERTGFNPHFKNDYFLLSEILGKLRPLLLKHKLCLIQGVEGSSVTTTIVDIDKDENKILSSITIPSGLDMQKQGSAISYAKRYLLTGMFLVEDRSDDDGEAAVGRGVETIAKVDGPAKKEAAAAPKEIASVPAPLVAAPAEKKKVSFSKKAFVKAAETVATKMLTTSNDEDL